MNAVATLGVTELSSEELMDIDGGLALTIAIASYLVGSFLAGVAIGVSNK